MKEMKVQTTSVNTVLRSYVEQKQKRGKSIGKSSGKST